MTLMFEVEELHALVDRDDPAPEVVQRTRELVAAADECAAKNVTQKDFALAPLTAKQLESFDWGDWADPSLNLYAEEDDDDRVIRQAHRADDEGCLSSLVVVAAVAGGLLAGAWKAVRR